MGTTQPVTRHRKGSEHGRFKQRLKAVSLQRAARFLSRTGGRLGSFQLGGSESRNSPVLLPHPPHSSPGTQPLAGGESVDWEGEEEGLTLPMVPRFHRISCLTVTDPESAAGWGGTEPTGVASSEVQKSQRTDFPVRGGMG